MDIFESFTDSRRKFLDEDNAYGDYIKRKYNVPIESGYVINNDIPDHSLAKSNDAHENDDSLTEDELIDTNDDMGRVWTSSSKHLYELFSKPGSRGRNTRFNEKQKTPKSDEEYARWGVEFMGSFNYNMAKMAGDYMALRNMDEETATRFYLMMEMYDRLPNFTWNGTKRMFKGIATDPTTYAGLGTLGLGFVGRAGTKQITKNRLMEVLKNKASPYVIGAVEGGVYTGLDDAIRQGVTMEAGLQDEFDPSRTAQAAGVGMAGGAALTGAIDAAPTVARAVGERLNQPGEMPVVGSMGGNIGVTDTAKLSNAEKRAFKLAATKNGTLDKPLFENVKAEALRIKNQYSPANGWLPIDINVKSNKPAFTVNKKGKIEIRWNQPAYNFHTPKGRTRPDVHKARLVDQTVSDVNAVLARAKAGDQAAIDIINQANWYRSMRSRLRTEFGGLADVFADILGATSAQTNVQQNYENALDVLRQFTRGEFDNEIAEYQRIVDSGEPRGSALFARDKDENDPFRLIRKATGALYNTNSAAATEALLDMFRQVKVGQSPKTINFTGNLIGFGNEATIDVWAARYLRDIAGLPRIPPPAEKAVAGKHLTGSTLDDPRIGGEFGFGQEVFSEAANKLNAAGDIKAFNSTLGDIGPDDLQAIVCYGKRKMDQQWLDK